MESGISRCMQIAVNVVSLSCMHLTWISWEFLIITRRLPSHSTILQSEVKIPFVSQTEINVHCVLIYHITHYNKRSCREMLLCDVYNFALTAARWLEFKRPLTSLARLVHIILGGLCCFWSTGSLQLVLVEACRKSSTNCEAEPPAHSSWECFVKLEESTRKFIPSQPSFNIQSEKTAAAQLLHRKVQNLQIDCWTVPHQTQHVSGVWKQCEFTCQAQISSPWKVASGNSLPRTGNF